MFLIEYMGSTSDTKSKAQGKAQNVTGRGHQQPNDKTSVLVSGWVTPSSTSHRQGSKEEERVARAVKKKISPASLKATRDQREELLMA